MIHEQPRPQDGRAWVAASWLVVACLSAWPLGLTVLQKSVPTLEVHTDGTGATGLAFLLILSAMLLAPILAIAAATIPLRKATLAARRRAWLAAMMASLSWLESSALRAYTEAAPGDYALSFAFFAFVLVVPAAVGGALLFALAGLRRPAWNMGAM